MIGSSEPHSATPKNSQPITVPGYGLVMMYPGVMVKYPIIEPKTMHGLLNKGLSND